MGARVMAIYHLSVSIIKRSAGYSAVAAAAYRSSEKLYEHSVVHAAAYRSGQELEKNEVVYDYTNKTGVVYTEILLPENTPTEFQNREILWNAVENAEKRKDAQLARELNIALPCEFSRQEQIEIMQEYIKENFVEKGMCADFAIHDKNDGNPHAHILLTTRDVTSEGFIGKNSDWNKIEHLREWRENWAKICNDRFKEKDMDERIDHRTLNAQGIDREPQIHIGAAAWAMEKRGIQTERGNMNREIITRNNSRTTEIMKGLEEKKADIDNIFRVYTEKQREMRKLTARADEMEKRFADAMDRMEKIDESKQYLKMMQSGQSEIKARIDSDIAQYERFVTRTREYLLNQFKVELEGIPEEVKHLRYQAEVLQKELLQKEELEYQRNIILKEMQRLQVQKNHDDRDIVRDRIYERYY